MRRLHWVLVGAVCLFGAKLSSVTALVDQLLKNYQMDEPPMLNSSTPVSVLFQLTIQSLQYIDERNQVAAMKLWIGMRWTDYRLVWDPDQHRGITVTTIRINKIWTPDIVIRNEYGNSQGFMYEDAIRADVDYNGTVIFWPVISARLSSILKLTYFPFDKQLVYIHLSAWTESSSIVRLNVADNVTLRSFHAHWDMVKTDHYKPTETFDGILFESIVYTVLLKRKPMFFIYSLVIPCILLSLLAIMIFTIPPSSGERISFGITILLSFTVLQLMLVDSMPKTSSISLLGIYITGVSFIVSLSIVTSIFTLNIGLREGQFMPTWLLNLAMLLRIKPTVTKSPIKVIGPSSDQEEPDTLVGKDICKYGDNDIRQQYDPLTVALVWDKICLVFFLILLITFTVSTLLIYPTFADPDESFDKPTMVS